MKNKDMKQIKCQTYHQKPTYEKWHSNEGTWGGRADNFCHLYETDVR